MCKQGLKIMHCGVFEWGWMTDTLTLYDTGMRVLVRVCWTPWTHRAGLAGLGVGQWGEVWCGAVRTKV